MNSDNEKPRGDGGRAAYLAYFDYDRRGFWLWLAAALALTAVACAYQSILAGFAAGGAFRHIFGQRRVEEHPENKHLRKLLDDLNSYY